MAISSELEHLLSQWLPRQPWFPRQQAVLGRVLASSPDVTPMSIAEIFRMPLPDGGEVYGWEVIIAVGGEGYDAAHGTEVHRLNIPLTYRTAEELSLRRHLIGQIDDLTLGRVWVYDAAADPAYVLTMAGAIAAGRYFAGDQVSVHRVGAAVPSLAALSAAESAAERLGSVEVSVSSGRAGVTMARIVDGEECAELTVFRRLDDSAAAAVHMPAVLTEADSQAVAHAVGWMSGRWFDGYELTERQLPILLLTAGEAEADTAWGQAVRCAVAVDSGTTGSFTAAAGSIGERIGELHRDLAGAFGVVPSQGKLARTWIQKWRERIDWALSRAPLALEPLSMDLHAHRERLAELDDIGGLQRIHGDLTLGNIAMTPTGGPKVRNFVENTGEGEGIEPKPLALDLVALLRSIDYAAGYGRLKRTGVLDGDAAPAVFGAEGLNDDHLRSITDSPEFEWSQRAQNALLTGYSRALAGSVTSDDPILRAVLIDRLLVEAVTELRNRPAWLTVPMAALAHILRGRPNKPTARGAVETADIEPTRVTHTVRAEPGSVWSVPGAAVSEEDFAEQSVLSLDDEPAAAEPADAEAADAEPAAEAEASGLGGASLEGAEEPAGESVEDPAEEPAEKSAEEPVEDEDLETAEADAPPAPPKSARGR